MRLVLIILSVVKATTLLSQMPDEFSFTPNNSSGIFQGQAQIDSVYADGEDWIAAFDESGICCGASQLIVYNGISYINLIIYGDDATTAGIDEGVNNGEAFSLKLYDASTNSMLDYELDDELVLFQNWSSTNGTPIPSYSNTDDIYVFSSLQIGFDQYISACENGEGVVLNGGFPQGGTYSGPGVVGSVFYPSIAQAGEHSITYSINNQVANINALVHPIEVPEIVNQGPYCTNGEDVPLQASINGGVFSGQGVVNNVFKPSLLTTGTYLLSYEVVDTNQCEASTDDFFEVFQAPEVGITVDGSLLAAEVSVGSANDFLWNTGETLTSITALESGGYWLIANDGFCKSDTAFTQVKLSPSDILPLNTFNINYCSLDKTIEITNLQNTLTFTLYSVTGQKLIVCALSDYQKIDLNKFPSGTYVVVVSDKNRQFVRKINFI